MTKKAEAVLAVNRKRRRQEMEDSCLEQDFLDACRLGLVDKMHEMIGSWKQRDRRRILQEYAEEALRACVLSKSLGKFKTILQYDRFLTHEHVLTAFECACKFGTDEIAHFILSQILKEGKYGSHKLHHGMLQIPIANKRVKTCKYFLEHCWQDAEDDEDEEYDLSQALCRAVDADCIEIVKLLLEYGADPEPGLSYNDALQYAESAEVARLLLKDKRVKDVQSALESAIQNNFSDVVAELLKDSRVDPEVCTDSLRDACRRGYADVVRVLAQDGRVEDWGVPMIVALENGQDDVAAVILQKTNFLAGYKVVVTKV